MEVLEISDTKVKRLIERIVLRPEDYVEVLGAERLGEVFFQYLNSRLGEQAPRKARYFGAGLLWSVNFNEPLYGRRDLGIYLSQTGERVPLQIIDEAIMSYLTETVGLVEVDDLPIDEQNEIARRHIDVIKVDKTNIEMVPVEAA